MGQRWGVRAQVHQVCLSPELPDAEAFRAEITRSQSSAENEIQKSLNKARSLKDAIDEAEQKLKGKTVAGLARQEDV